MIINPDKIINVQPLTEPVGLIYYLRYKYAQHQEKLENKNEPVYKGRFSAYRSIDDDWLS